MENRKKHKKVNVPSSARASQHAYFGDFSSMPSAELLEIYSELGKDFDKKWKGPKVKTWPSPYILLGDD